MLKIISVSVYLNFGWIVNVQNLHSSFFIQIFTQIFTRILMIFKLNPDAIFFGSIFVGTANIVVWCLGHVVDLVEYQRNASDKIGSCLKNETNISFQGESDYDRALCAWNSSFRPIEMVIFCYCYFMICMHIVTSNFTVSIVTFYIFKIEYSFFSSWWASKLNFTL